MAHSSYDLVFSSFFFVSSYCFSFQVLFFFFKRGKVDTDFGLRNTDTTCHSNEFFLIVYLCKYVKNVIGKATNKNLTEKKKKQLTNNYALWSSFFLFLVIFKFLILFTENYYHFLFLKIRKKSNKIITLLFHYYQRSGTTQQNFILLAKGKKCEIRRGS